MAKTKYIYTGPPSGMNLKDTAGKEIEISLIPGKDVELESDSPHVKSLIKRGCLTTEARVDRRGSKDNKGKPALHSALKNRPLNPRQRDGRGVETGNATDKKGGKK